MASEVAEAGERDSRTQQLIKCATNALLVSKDPRDQEHNRASVAYSVHAARALDGTPWQKRAEGARACAAVVPHRPMAEEVGKVR